MTSETRRLIRDLRASGWTIRPGGRHILAYAPGSAKPVPIPCSPSDPRSMQNTLTKLRHAANAEGPQP